MTGFQKVSGFAPYPEPHLEPPYPPDNSFMLVRMNIEPGQVVELDASRGDQWAYGAYFRPSHFIYVGSPDLWILKKSRVDGAEFIISDTPCDTYKPTCPTWVDWPPFSCLHLPRLFLFIENRGKEVGHFISRFAGNFVATLGFESSLPERSGYPCPTKIGGPYR